MRRINYGKKTIQYAIRRTRRRRTVAISIEPDAKVTVSTPQLLSKEKIEDIVRKKAPWILDKQNYFRELAKFSPEKEFISGEQFLLLGRRYRLKVNRAQGQCLNVPRLTGRKILVSVNRDLEPEKKREIIRKALIKWYISQSAGIVRQRVRRYSKLIGVIPREVKVKNQKKRWGSCSNDGVLRFSWKIAMAPVTVLDYVVVHELCHLKIKTHSSDFWKLVSSIFPDHKSRRDWLKNNITIFSI